MKKIFNIKVKCVIRELSGRNLITDEERHFLLFQRSDMLAKIHLTFNTYSITAIAYWPVNDDYCC